MAEAGARFARRWGLLRSGFAVRLADIVLGLDRASRAAFFLGAVVGSDLAELSRWPGWAETSTILVGGREPLRSLYGRLFASGPAIQCEVLEESIVSLAAARGALAIVERAVELGASGFPA